MLQTQRRPGSISPGRLVAAKVGKNGYGSCVDSHKRPARGGNRRLTALATYLKSGGGDGRVRSDAKSASVLQFHLGDFHCGVCTGLPLQSQQAHCAPRFLPFVRAQRGWQRRWWPATRGKGRHQEPGGQSPAQFVRNGIRLGNVAHGVPGGPVLARCRGGWPALFGPGPGQRQLAGLHGRGGGCHAVRTRTVHHGRLRRFGQNCPGSAFPRSPRATKRFSKP